MAETSSPTVNWRRAHHIALATSDLDATVNFYHYLLGMPLVGGSGANPVFPRHYVFDAGEFQVGFFERAEPDGPGVAPGWSQGFRLVPGALQHLALEMADEETLQALRQRLVDRGVEVTEWLHEGPMRQFLFADNNGILWEVNWTPEGTDLEEDGVGAFGDLDPVPAARAIIAARSRGGA